MLSPINRTTRSKHHRRDSSPALNRKKLSKVHLNLTTVESRLRLVLYRRMSHLFLVKSPDQPCYQNLITLLSSFNSGNNGERERERKKKEKASFNPRSGGEKSECDERVAVDFQHLQKHNRCGEKSK